MDTASPAPPDFDDALRAQLVRTWTDGIPLARFLQLELASLDASGLCLQVPLEPGRNHMGTGFAGALQASMTLAGWGLAAALLHRERPHDLVAQSSSVNFLLPVRERFEAFAVMPPGADVAAFLERFRRHGKSRLKLRVRATVRGEFHATGEVHYAAIAHRSEAT